MWYALWPVRTMYTWLPGFLTKEMHQGIAKSFAWVLTAQAGR